MSIKVYGPTMHGRKWRVELREGDRRRYKSFESPADAARYAEKTRKTAQTAGTTIDHYIDQFLAELGRRNLSPETIRMQRYAIRGLLQPVQDQSPVSITPERARTLYKAMHERWAVMYHREALKKTRRFWSWLTSEGVVKTNPWNEVQGVGKPNRGKTQLSIDETRQFIGYCLEHDLLPAVLAVVMGLRAGEIVRLTVRDIDNNGTVLRVNGKTGFRPVLIPRSLQGVLLDQARTVGSGRLWPQLTTRRLRYYVRKACQTVGVTVVTTHGLRGTRSTLALLALSGADQIASDLGHSTLETTKQSYFAPGAFESARSQGVEQLLLGDGIKAAHLQSENPQDFPEG